MAPRDNRYAWRLNCEDGSDTVLIQTIMRQEKKYNEALSREKHRWRDYCEDDLDYGISPEDYETEEEYNAAIDTAESNSFNKNEMMKRSSQMIPPRMLGWDISPMHAKSGSDPIRKHDPYAADDFHVYVYCLVKLDETNTKKFTERRIVPWNEVRRFSFQTKVQASNLEETIDFYWASHEFFCSKARRKLLKLLEGRDWWMDWDSYYEKFYDWATSTQIKRCPHWPRLRYPPKSPRSRRSIWMRRLHHGL